MSKETLVCQRNYGIDCLRIISMLMVCSLHILGEIVSITPDSEAYWIVELLRIICLCSVNCYALISGYVGVDSKHKIEGLFKLWLTVTFYTLSISLIFFIISPELFSLENLIKSFMPVISIQYWYFSSYFLLFFFMPLVNTFMQYTDIKRKSVIMFAVILISFCSTILSAVGDLWSLNKGFSAFWLFVMYFVGAFLKKHKPKGGKMWGFIFIGSILLSFTCKFFIYRLGFDDTVIADSLFAYYSPAIVLSAISLLLYFSEINPGKLAIKIIRFFAPLSFSVYLIHYNKYVWNYLCQGLSWISDCVPLSIPLLAIACAVIIYLICTFIDVLRSVLFKLIDVDRFCNVVVNKLKLIFDSVLSWIF